ncbi:hypothetical protein GALMADRAFT_756980 [Galerina marginata CBS 339.88]|uniref:Uncharacterized protein n=1 Tax=Galerina marginata (strain CBS 339.88) TaxID=685588 RepID=A0A067SNV1_GALM3|nr:hypothetical protein GALMADRAFT_756980 [Galerina marginata CBS 339.88]
MCFGSKFWLYTFTSNLKPSALPGRHWQSLVAHWQTFNHSLASIDIQSHWLRHVVNGPPYILNVVPFTLLVEPFLFWQPRLHRYTFDRMTDVAANIYLEHLIENAKMSTILLTFVIFPFLMLTT